MGQQSCVVLLGFAAMHVAFIMCVVALASPYWIFSHTDYGNQTFPSNETLVNSTTKGLWKKCVDDDCFYFFRAQSVYFNGIRFSYTVGIAFLLVALVMEYIFFLVAHFQKLPGYYIIIAGFITSACVLITVTVSLFCKYGPQSHDMLQPIKLGWAAYIALGGMVFTFCACVLVAWEMCLLLKTPVLYRDL